MLLLTRSTTVGKAELNKADLQYHEDNIDTFLRVLQLFEGANTFLSILMLQAIRMTSLLD